jgi:hypothetical protein
MLMQDSVPSLVFSQLFRICFCVENENQKTALETSVYFFVTLPASSSESLWKKVV